VPTAAPSPCRTCGQLRCSTHARKPWAEKASTTKRSITGRALQAARERLYTKQGGCCALCGAYVVYGTTSFIRDHIVSLAERGADVEANTQGLCESCSETKTKHEALRGAARSRYP
jgi:5-methylcytosine-specific restriction endonuclease McrA